MRLERSALPVAISWLAVLIASDVRGAIEPLDRHADALAAVVGDRRDGEAERAAAEIDGGAMRLMQPRQHPALVRRILVEHVDVRAEQLRRLEVRQVLADVGLGGAEHLDDGAVHVDDLHVAVGDHHVGGDVVEADLDAQVLVADAPRLLHLEAQAHLHRLQRLQHAAGLVVAGDVDAVLVVARGEAAEGVHRLAERRTDGARHPVGHRRGRSRLPPAAQACIAYAPEAAPTEARPPAQSGMRAASELPRIGLSRRASVWRTAAPCSMRMFPWVFPRKRAYSASAACTCSRVGRLRTDM